MLIELAKGYRLQGRAADAVALLAPVTDATTDPAARRELAHARLDTGDYEIALAESTALIEEIDLSTLQSHELPVLMEVYEVAAEAARGSGDSIRAAVLYNAIHGVLRRHGRRDLAEQITRLEQQHSATFQQQQRRVAETIAALPDLRFQDLLTQSRQQNDEGHIFAALDASYDALAIDSQSLQPFLEIARSYVLAAQPAAATTLLRSIEEVAKRRESPAELASAEHLLGRVSGDRDLRRQAVAHWLAQGKLEEAVPELWDLAGEAAEAGQLPVAVDLYRQLLAVYPEHDFAPLALAEALVRLGQEPEALAALEAAAARRAASGKPDAALTLWHSAAVRLPDLAAVRRAYGEWLVRRGRPLDGVRELSWAAEIASRQGGPDAITSRLRLCQVYDELDDVPGALRSYDQLLRQAPGDARVQEHFVGFCLRRRRPDLAGRTLRTLAEHLLSRADGGSPAEAIAALTQLMVLQPDDPWAYEQLAAVLQREGRQHEVLQVYRQLAARRPHDARIQQRVDELTRASSAGGTDVLPSEPASGV